MTSKLGLMERFEAYRPTKAVLFWCCILSVAGTMVVGFTWGGWVSGGTATAMANQAAEGASAKLAAAVCTAQFRKEPDAGVQLAALAKLDTWQRSDFISKGGWTKLPGVKEPVSGAADLCAKQLSESKL